MRGAVYNENDPAAAAWLTEMIRLGEVAPGEVDTRSIKDVDPDDYTAFAQVHLFAGIGGWPFAARLAGWPDTRPLWTGSCPCQPFSAAGQGGGVDDPRHLWPDFFRLVRGRRPPVLVGEQVAGTAGYGWLDGVRADLEGEDYACRGVDLPACAMDAPHIRNRLYWVAVADAQGLGGWPGLREDRAQRDGPVAANGDGARAMVDTQGLGRGQGGAAPDLQWGRPAATGADAPSHVANADGGGREGDGQPRQQRPDHARGADGGHLGDGDGARLQGFEVTAGTGGAATRRRDAERADGDHGGHAGGPVADAYGPVGGERDQQPAREQPLDEPHPGAGLWAGSGNGGPAPSFWAEHEWIACHDGKARRTQPGTPLLAHGVPNRVALWRGFGNAVSPPLAAQVLAALMDVLP